MSNDTLAAIKAEHETDERHRNWLDVPRVHRHRATLITLLEQANERIELLETDAENWPHSEIDRLREGLRKYGRHLRDCNMGGMSLEQQGKYATDALNNGWQPAPCTCGLDELLGEST